MARLRGLCGAGGRLGHWLGALVLIGLLAACSDLDQDVANEVSRADHPWTSIEESMTRQGELFACVDAIVPEREGLASDVDEQNTYYRERLGAMLECDPNLTNDHEVMSELVRDVDVHSAADVDGYEFACLLDELIAKSDDPAQIIAQPESDNDFLLWSESAYVCFDHNSIALLGLPNLDVLSDGCQAGDDIACDLLYFDSLPASDYEDVALDCAGRGNGIDYCIDGIEYDANGLVDPTSYGINYLLSECEVSGSMGACDLLVYMLLEDTEPYVVGTTCGGRRDESIDSLCRIDYP